ncbi:MAG: hypothetical protein U1B80_02790, partial [Anaerolineaceae bacterium]|nr:hypothetical protein [Anaerolineaceae bacterium]
MRNHNSTERLVFVVILVLIFAAAVRAPLDSDMWWHLRAGEATWQNGSPLLEDEFSYTRFGERWINHSWLAQLGMFLIHEAGGWFALSGAVGLLAAISMALVYLQMDGPGLFRAFLLVLGSVVISPVWSPRPQLISLTLFAGVAYLLTLYKRQGKDYLWLLPIIFLLWSNLHGGYVLGLMLIGIMVVGEALNQFLGTRGAKVLTWKGISRLAFWGAGSVFALLINPNGVDTWLVPFRTVGVEALNRFISEWASPDFHDITQQPFLWLFFLLFAAVWLSGRRIDFTEIISTIWFAVLALFARRNFGPFALVALPVLASHLWQMLSSESFRKRLPVDFFRIGLHSPAAWRRALNLAIVGVLGFVALGKLYAVTHPALLSSAVVGLYPAGAVNILKGENPTGNLLNEYDWGGYLVWNMREWQVFVDGRTDLYGDEIIGQWITAVQAEKGWQDVLEGWDIRYALLKPNRPLVT